MLAPALFRLRFVLLFVMLAAHSGEGSTHPPFTAVHPAFSEQLGAPPSISRDSSASTSVLVSPTAPMAIF